MKVLKSFMVLFSFIIFLMLGCSDKSQFPVAPTDQQSTLAKSVITEFTLTDSPLGLTGEGDVTLVPGGKWQLKKYGVIENIVSSSPLVQGTMKHYLSCTLDAITGEGPCHGTWTLTPADLSVTGGGIWEGKYEGYRSQSVVPGEWTLALKLEGHGKGGTIDGMQTFTNSILTIYTDGVTVLPAYWIGTGEGYYKSH